MGRGNLSCICYLPSDCNIQALETSTAQAMVLKVILVRKYNFCLSRSELYKSSILSFKIINSFKYNSKPIYIIKNNIKGFREISRVKDIHSSALDYVSDGQ